MRVNINDTTPAALTGKKNIKWQTDGSTPENASGYFDLDIAIVSVSATGTVASSAIETIERVTTSSSNKTRTLPAATGSGVIIVGKKVDSGTGNAIYTAAGTDTIDGSATYTLVNQYQFVRLLDAAAGAWDVIGGN